MVEQRNPQQSSTWPVESILDGLTGQEQMARQEAEEALLKIGSPAIDSLVNRLRTGHGLEPSVRISIVRILGKIGWQPANDIEKALFHIARQEWKELAAVGPAAVSPLLEILNDSDQPVRKDAARALGDIGDSSAVEPLISALKDNNKDLRIEAACALGKIKNIMAVDPLSEALKDNEEEVRKSAYQALSGIDSPEASRSLFNRLKVVNRQVGERLLDLLDKRGWEPSTPAEMALFLVAHRRWKEVSKLGKDAVEPLINVLNQEDYLVRRDAIGVLAEIKDNRAVKPLLLELNDEHEVVREAAVNALIEIGPPHLAGPLSGALTHKLARTRALAAEILDNTGWKPADNKELARYLIARRHWHIIDKLGEAAEEPLLHALNDSEPSIRSEAAVCLGKINAIPSIIPLAKKLTDEKKEVADAAKLALSMFRSPQAVEPLIQCLEDASESSAAIIAGYLADIGDVYALPYLYRLKSSFSKWQTVNNNTVNISSVSGESLAAVLENALVRIHSHLSMKYKDLLCGTCYMWFAKHKIKLGFLNTVRYYACPKCHHNSTHFKHVDQIVLRMVYGEDRPWKLEKNVLTVDWYHHKEPFDFDVIHIEHANDHEIEELVMTLTNDVNDRRRKQLSKTAVYLSPHLIVSQSRINLLSDYFTVFREHEVKKT